MKTVKLIILMIVLTINAMGYKLDSEQYALAFEEVYEMETDKMDTILEVGNVSKLEERRIIRKIENNGKYYGKSKYSSAWGAYQFTRGTAKFVINDMHKHGRYKYITIHNWKNSKTYQDIMYNWYRDYNQRIVSVIDNVPENAIVTYMSWQSGPGGFMNYWDCLVNHNPIKLNYSTIKTNLPKQVHRQFESYLYNKFLAMMHEQDKHCNSGIKSYHNHMSIYNFKRLVKKYNLDEGGYEIELVDRTLVQLLFKTYSDKIKSYKHKTI